MYKKLSNFIFPPPPKYFFGTIIDFKNVIVVLNDYPNIYNFSNLIYPRVKGRIDLICGLWWTHEEPKYILKLLFRLVLNFILFPRVKVHILCNTRKEYEILRKFGISCVFCNQNAFLDENVFKLIENENKIYNSVYNAVLSDFKRHHLCENLKKNVMLTYNFKNEPYKQKLETILKDTYWINYDQESNKPVFLNNNQILKVYNQSKVGLALSKIEGAMYVSGEYLLCGIPIVSTYSKGGRDVFFTPYNSIICKATKEDVEKSVNELLARNCNPIEIRESTIEMMKAHRLVFIDFVNKIYKQRNINQDISKSWDKWFVNKLRNEYSKEDLENILNNK